MHGRHLRPDRPLIGVATTDVGHSQETRPARSWRCWELGLGQGLGPVGTKRNSQNGSGGSLQKPATQQHRRPRQDAPRLTQAATPLQNGATSLLIRQALASLNSEVGCTVKTQHKLSGSQLDQPT
jgi:hypothetical protein